MKFSVGTFNVESLVTPGKAIYDNKKPRYTPQQYQAKIDWTKNQLLTMDADIIGFQEVFDERSLRDCISGTPYEHWHLFFGTREFNKGGNALLSKFPILSAQSIDEIPFVFDFFDSARTVTEHPNPISIPIKRFSRSLIRAEIQLRDDTIMIVYVAHLKSKHPILPDGLDRDKASYAELAKGSVRSLIRRGIESAGVRTLLSQDIDKDIKKPIVFVGDLNDTDTAVTNQIILGPPPFFRLEADERAAKWQYTFQDSVDIQARKSINNFHFTYIHNGHHESLDNIFVSNHFALLNQHAIGRVIDIRAYNDHVIDDTISFDRKPISVSDHGQVVMNVVLFER
ncbi:MAG: endonuclease/exonuclease/phosphatase family protein [Candidatus Babeliales bacterium]|nr:endonuclease/exonuclease/phosphatase family protein [Candidatus Babeliales bacterium]